MGLFILLFARILPTWKMPYLTTKVLQNLGDQKQSGGHGFEYFMIYLSSGLEG